MTVRRSVSVCRALGKCADKMVTVGDAFKEALIRSLQEYGGSTLHQRAIKSSTPPIQHQVQLQLLEVERLIDQPIHQVNFRHFDVTDAGRSLRS